MEWTADLVDVEAVNSEITVNKESKEHHVSQQDLSNKVVSDQLNYVNMVLSDFKSDSVASTLFQEGPQTTKLSQSDLLLGRCVQEIVEQTVICMTLIMCSWLSSG